MSRTRNRPTKRPKSPEPETSNPNQPGSSNPKNNPKELHPNGPIKVERVVWSKYDVVLIMEGMLDFIALNGVDSMTTSVDAFVDFINNRRNQNKNKNDDSLSYSAGNVMSKISCRLEKIGSNEKDYVLHLEAHNVGMKQKNDGSVVSEKKMSLGKNDGGFRRSSSVSSEKEETVVGEKKVCVGSKEHKRGEKSKSTENGGEKNTSVGVSKSKSRARGSRRRGRGKKSGLGKCDVGVSCSSAKEKEKINVVEKKVNCVNNVEGNSSSHVSKSMEKKSGVSGENSKLKTDNGGENKGSTNSVTVKRLRLRRKRKTTAIIHVGKKSNSKTKKNGGMKQKKNHQIREARKGEVKRNNFGLSNENEMIASEAISRMISRWVSIRDELQTDVSWHPPKIGVLKWNTDASLREEDGTSAIGGVLRDWNGSYRCVFSCLVDCVDSNEVELRAIYKALELASCKDWLLSIKMVIESDSMNAVKWCNEDAGGSLNLSYMLGFIRECRMWLPGLEIRYMGRKSNSVADRLAKQGHKRTTDFVAWM